MLFFRKIKGLQHIILTNYFNVGKRFYQIIHGACQQMTSLECYRSQTNKYK